MSTITSQARASDRFLSVLAAYDGFLVVAHDNPDPDAIASGWAVCALIEDRLHKPVRLVAGGAIVRAENKHMVELLDPPLCLVNELAPSPGTATILVDSQPGASNHLLTRAGIRPVAVIDHHLNGNGGNLAFKDVRTDAAASASIAASYLREQRVAPGAKLATALLYAIRTETCGYESCYSALDRSLLPWLTERAEPELLAEIDNAPLPRAYFGDLVLAMQSTFLYDDSALCLLPRAQGAEIVGEVADLLIRCQGIDRVFCGALCGDDLIVSVRTAKDNDSAAKLLEKTLNGLGGGGGHAHRAGGKIPGAGRAGRISEELQDELRTRWLAATGVDRQRGTRLVARREIVDNL